MPAYADAGVDPIDFPVAPTVALPIALKRANLTVDDISLFEINEAFSVVARIAERVLNIPAEKMNVNGWVLLLFFDLEALLKMLPVVRSPSDMRSAILVRVSSSPSYMPCSQASTVLPLFAMV